MITENGQIDLRLKKEKKVYIEYSIEREFKINHAFEPLRANPSSQFDIGNTPIPKHLYQNLLSYFPKAISPTSYALDLGCGTGIHKEILEKFGYKYIGLDYERSGADILGDAHALPFVDNCFDFVLSIAVLEHIQYPFLYSQEVFRVLKPNGTFIGSVAFLEPFHSRSFYHHTHLGTYNTIKSAGFTDIIVAPNKKWNVLRAQAKNLFPRLPKQISRGILMPLYLLHLLWWWVLKLKMGKSKGEIQRILKMTASYFFIAKK